MGTEVFESIEYGGRNAMTIDVIVGPSASGLIAKGQTFTLHDGPSRLVAHGIIRDVEVLR
jgi:hypothetical protein